MTEAHVEEATQSLQTDDEVIIQLGGNGDAEAPIPEEVLPDPVVVPEEAPKELEAMEKKMADLEKQLQDLAPQTDPFAFVDTPQPEVVVEPGTPDFGDIYADPDGYNKNVQNYIKEQAEQAREEAKKSVLESDEFKAMSNTVYSAAHDRQVTAAENEFEGFNYKDNSAAILQVQQLHPGLTIQDAHRMLDYNRQAEELRQMKEGQDQRQNAGATPTTNGARFVEKTDNNTIKVKATATDKERAAKFYGGDVKASVEARLRAEKRQRGEE